MWEEGPAGLFVHSRGSSQSRGTASLGTQGSDEGANETQLCEDQREES